MADITISGQSGANPAQAGTSGTNKSSLKAGVPFDLLLAIFQAGGLPGQIIPGPNGQLELTCDISSMTDAQLIGKSPGKQAISTSELIQSIAQLQAVCAKGKGETAADSSGVPDVVVEAAKTGVANMIALLNSSGKSSATSVSANAVKPGSPALINAMAKADGQAAAAAGATGMAGASGLAALAGRGLSNVNADIAGKTAAGQKAGDAGALSTEGARPEKSDRDILADKAKITAAKAAGADIPAGLKDGSQETSGKNPDAEILSKAAAAGAETLRLKVREAPGDKTPAPVLKTEAAKAPQSENAANSARIERPETAAAARVNNPLETAGVKGTEIRVEKEAEPRVEPVKTPGQTVQGGMHAQSSPNVTVAAADPGADIGFGEALNGAMLEQVSAGTMELFRDGGGRVRLSLNPPELGSVDMDLIVDRNGVKLVLASDSGDVRHVLQANMDQLRSSLHDQGTGRFDILVQDRSNSDAGNWQAGGNSGRDTLQSGGNGANGQFRDDGAPAFSRPAADSRPTAATTHENLNGELSLFA